MTFTCNDNVALTKKKKDVDCDGSEARLQKVKMDKGSKRTKTTFWKQPGYFWFILVSGENHLQ